MNDFYVWEPIVENGEVVAYQLAMNLDALTTLEDKYVRQVDSGVKPDGQEDAADSN